MNTNILLLEDDESLCRAVSLKLSKEGYRVYAAEDIETALSFYREQNIPLILCDIDLHLYDEKTGTCPLHEPKTVATNINPK